MSSPFYTRRVYSGGVAEPPSRDDILGLNGGLIHFQGLIVPTTQFGNIPGFEAAIAWLDPSDRNIWWSTKKSAGDSHALIQLPFGPPLYDEPNQPYNKDNFPALDWTSDLTLLDNLIRDTISAGFNKIFLFLGGDGPNNQPIAMHHLDLLAANNDYYNTLYKYCIVIPGWDSVFYGWEPTTKITDFGSKFRSIWPNGYLGLEHNEGHIPLGEGGGDYLPGGRMKDFDLILSEYDQNLHQDSCWQINGRLTKNYKRPSDQPSGDDPNPPYYLSEPNLRGSWGHCAFEYGEYEFVRDSNVSIVDTNRSYLRSMGCTFLG